MLFHDIGNGIAGTTPFPRVKVLNFNNTRPAVGGNESRAIQAEVKLPQLVSGDFYDCVGMRVPALVTTGKAGATYALVVETKGAAINFPSHLHPKMNLRFQG